MFAIMSFQNVRRLRVLKLFWLEGFWIQNNVPPLTSLSTKANNAKKPVRYTSIKKAKPKTINDIAKLLQQRSKETKERQQSVMSTSTLTSAPNTAKPAPPNQANNQSDGRATIISTAEVQTSSINLPAQDSSESATHLDSEPVQVIADVEAAASCTNSSLNEACETAVESRTACETGRHTALIDAAVDFAYSKHTAQMAMEGSHNEIYTDSIAKSGDSDVFQVFPTTINTTREASDMITNISQTSQTSELISSYHDVVCSPEAAVNDETVYMHEVMKASNVIATPEVSSVAMNGHQESGGFSDVVTKINASDIINITQSQSTQSQEVHASNSSDIKPTSSQEFISQSFPNGTPDTIDISNAEAIALASGGVPVFAEVCHEEAIPSSDPIPELSSFKSAEDPPVFETISVSPNEAVKLDGVSEVSGETQCPINLKDLILAQTDNLKEEKQTDTVEKLPEAQLDPIQRLFLDKIREYSTKSQASGGLVDAGPEYEKALNEERTKLQRLYGGGDLRKFPEFTFSEPLLDENN